MCSPKMAGQLESYMVGEPMPMINIHSVFWCLLLIISGFRCFAVLRYFYELVSKGYISVPILSTNSELSETPD